jgi:hypothetical protein
VFPQRDVADDLRGEVNVATGWNLGQLAPIAANHELEVSLASLFHSGRLGWPQALWHRSERLFDLDPGLVIQITLERASSPKFGSNSIESKGIWPRNSLESPETRRLPLSL